MTCPMVIAGIMLLYPMFFVAQTATFLLFTFQ